ncbi:MAG: pentapeptide repeat-containing protein, partial [Lachnospiraceae bacterium]|nr:pentapeptide repeat-containing protein [Lachnospiraceae bacterium]
NILNPEIIEYLCYKILWTNSVDHCKDVYGHNKKASIECGLFLNKTFSAMLKNGMLYLCDEDFKNAMECELNVFCNMMKILENCHDSKSKLKIKDKKEFITYLCHEHVRNGRVVVSYVNLEGAEFKNVSLKGSVFQGVNLKRANFHSVDLSDVHFIDVDLSETEFHNVKLNRAIFSRVNLENALFQKSEAKGISLENLTINSRIVNVDLQGARLKGLSIKYLDLRESYLKDIDLDDIVISEDIPIILDDTIVDQRLFCGAEKILQDKMQRCKIDMCDNILTYAEYKNFLNQRLPELQEEISELIKGKRDYSEM